MRACVAEWLERSLSHQRYETKEAIQACRMFGKHLKTIPVKLNMDATVPSMIVKRKVTIHRDQEFWRTGLHCN